MNMQNNEKKAVIYEEEDFYEDEDFYEGEDQEQANKIISKIESYFSNEKNTATFMNYTSTLFFNFYITKKIAIKEHIFYRVFFLFQKFQLIIFKNILAIMEGKKDQSFFTKVEWGTYIKSSEFSLTQQAIKNDTDFMLPYFKEVFKRTKGFLEEALSKEDNPKIKNNIKNFSAVLSEKFEIEEQFQSIFNDNINEFIDLVRRYVVDPKKVLKDKDFLLVVRLFLISLERDKEFKWDANQARDFHKFYEDYENVEEGALLEELLKILA